MADAGPLESAGRVDALRRTALLDTPPEEAFDRLTGLAARLLDVPISLVSLIEPQRQFMKSVVGAPEGMEDVRELPLSYSFCQHVVRRDAPVVIEDTRLHELGDDNLAVSELGVTAYAGYPLRDSDGEVLGSFCVMDVTPRTWTEEELSVVRELAESVATEIRLRTAVVDALGLVEERRLLAREINDRVLQQLATAKLALEVGRRAEALDALGAGIAEARALVESSLAADDLRPGGLRRRLS